MKVLHIVRHLHKLSGVSVYCSGVCDALAKGGVDVTIGVANMVDSNRLESNCGVPRAQADGLLANKDDWDVVHIHNLWTPDLHRAAVWARRFNVPVVWSLHGTLSPWSFKYKWWKKCLPWYLYQKRDLKSAAVLHVTSEGEDRWVRDAGFANQRIVNIPMGTEIRPETVRKHDIHRLLFVGRIAPVKSLEKLIQAWAKVDRANWRLRIVGIEDFPGYTDSLKALCRQFGVADSVEFVGQKFGQDLEDEYAQADALALVSETENFGAVVADALAWGLPVITSKGTPWREVEGEKEVVVGSGRGEVVVESGSGTVEEREGRGRDTRSTVEDGSQTISCAARVNEIEVVPGTLGGKIALTTNPTGTTSICATILLNGVLDVNGVPLLAGDEGESEVVVGSGSGTMKRSASNTQTLKHSNNSSRCGWWVDNDPETLAKALRELMALSDEERQAMGLRGRDLVRKKYSWAAVASAMKMAYESILKGVA